MRDLMNEQLSLDDVPGDDADWAEISEFALTFNGYVAWGSYGKCAEIANARNSNTLTELRTSLFFEERCWQRLGEEPHADDMDYIRGLVRAIRHRVIAQDLA